MYSHGVLIDYLRISMLNFSQSPQAAMLRRFCRTEELQQTFDKKHIESLRLQNGYLVCGVYRVQGKVGSPNGNRVTLSFGPVEGYEGPILHGALVVGCSVISKDTVFTNDTYMWRKVDEKPLFLESWFGQWMHVIFVSRLVGSGVRHLQRVASGDE